MGMQFFAVLGSRTAEQGKLADQGVAEQTCDMIGGAVKRNGWHIGTDCKCKSHDAILSEKCGSQSGNRTFSLGWLNQDMRGLWNAKRNGCACVQTSQNAGDDAEQHLKERHVTAEVTLCGHVEHAVSRSYLFPGACECPEDYFLSPECGDRAGERYFEAKDDTLRNTNCRCQPKEEEDEQPAKEEDEQPAAKEEDEQPTKTEGSVNECEHPFPEGFQLGDIVRIVKKGSRVDGAVARVVCSLGTSGVKGRICLRYANKQNSAGCWLPANLEKL